MLLAPIYPTDAPAPGAVALADIVVTGYLFAEFIIGNDGILYHREGSANYPPSDPIGAWIDPQVGMSLYECRATPSTSTQATGNYDAWLDLAQSWGWALDVRQERTSAWGNLQNESPLTETWTDRSATFLLEIRRKSDLVVVVSVNVTVSAGGNA